MKKKIGMFGTTPIVVSDYLENILNSNEMGLIYEDGGIRLVRRNNNGDLETVTTNIE